MGWIERNVDGRSVLCTIWRRRRPRRTPATRAAVVQLQADSGLPATGQVDTVTWQALQGQSC
jgi:peptidoglycan hydrolase-like protein with peptidoglycan-binding domain